MRAIKNALPAMPDASFATVELTIGAACRVRFDVPSAWSGTYSKLAPNTPVMDSEGRLPVRFAAKSPEGAARLEVSASAMQLPMGLTPAVVYWLGLYGLDETAGREQVWDSCSAFAGCFGLNGESVGIAWVQTPDAIIEFQLHARARELAHATLATLRDSFSAESLPQDQTPQADTWWTRVRTLRDEGRLEDAFALADREGTVAGVLLVQADLRGEQMRIAQRRGEHEAARAAWHSAVSCIHAYGASATSGGEGAARAIACERALKELGPEPTAP